MNFKTTFILVILLGAAGAWLYFSHPSAPKTDTTTNDQGTKFLDIDAKDVTQIAVTPSDGTPFTLQKIGTDWQLIQPVKAPAETFEVDSLIRGFTDAVTHGQIDPSGVNAGSTGLAAPRYQVQLVTASKTIKIAVGDKSAVGDGLYVKLDSKTQADIIPADVSAKLDAGSAGFRKKNLVASASVDSIKQISITRPDGKITLEKTGASWQMTAPRNMPVDDTAVSDLVFAINGLQADSFADPATTPSDVFARPQLSVSFTTEAPTTAPATGPAWTTVHFGNYEDILKKNVYASVEGSNVIAKVTATSMDGFKKKPLEFRDKKAVDLASEEVSKIVVQTNMPSTTQPTTRPAVSTTLILDRRKKSAAVMGPSTQAASQPATQPAQSKWIVASESSADADDVKVNALLSALHPLRADKYLDGVPTTQPAAQYELTLTTVGPFGSPIDEHHLTLIDPGHDQPLIGSYNGLAFETSRSLLSDFEGPWARK